MWFSCLKIYLENNDTHNSVDHFTRNAYLTCPLTVTFSCAFPVSSYPTCGLESLAVIECPEKYQIQSNLLPASLKYAHVLLPSFSLPLFQARVTQNPTASICTCSFGPHKTHPYIAIYS